MKAVELDFHEMLFLHFLAIDVFFAQWNTFYVIKRRTNLTLVMPLA